VNHKENDKCVRDQLIVVSTGNDHHLPVSPFVTKTYVMMNGLTSHGKVLQFSLRCSEKILQKFLVESPKREFSKKLFFAVSRIEDASNDHPTVAFK